MGTDLVIETKGLTKVFGRLVAVDSLDLKIRRGEIHGFVGPNGAGKSTAIKMLVGAVRPTRGQGFVRDFPMGSVNAKNVIGYSPERPSFYNDMAAWDYLVYMAALSGMEPNKARDRANELLCWLELSGSANSRIAGFSAGMKQRLSIAQAMMHGPELLILDEPTANLDPGGRISLMEKLKSLPKEQKLTVFISSHILPELEYLIDTVTLIQKGKVIAEDSVEAMKREMSSDSWALDTSDNEAVLKALRCKGEAGEMWLESDGTIRLRSLNRSTIQQAVMEAVAESEVELWHFGREQVRLDDVYRRKIGKGEDQQLQD